MGRSLRWGLVGASDIAATRVIPAMRALGDEVVGVMSGSAEHGQRYATRHAVPFATTALDALLDRDDVDAVYVSSTNDKHHAQTMAALGAGKHVLCEKPMALSLADAAEMVGAAGRAGLVLAVNHHLPGAGTHRTVQRLVRDGAIGTPLAVRVAHAVLLPERLRGWRLGNAPGSGVILDITCHDASVIDAVLGLPALSVTAAAASQGHWGPGGPDAAMTTIRYGEDVLAQTHDAFTVGFAPTRFEVLGTDGAVTATEVMTQDPVGEVRLRDAAGEREVPVADRRDLYEILLGAFRAATRGEGRPTVDGIAGTRALAVALAAQEAAETGRAVPVQAARP